MPKNKKTIPESKLIKALAELEGVAKGDELEDADPEGGLSTEGTPLSDEAPSGRGETKKSRGAPPFGGSSSSDSSSDDDDDSSDDASSDPPPPPKKDKAKKSVRKAESDAGSDDESDDAEKSFREMADEDETMSKAIIVNDFIEAMVDQISVALHRVSKSIAKSLAGLEERLTSRIDDTVAKSTATQQAFNVRLAKAVAAIGTTIQDDLSGVADVVKSLADQPVGSPRGKAVLSKGEINQPPWSGAQSVGADQRLANGSEDYVDQLKELSSEAIGDWLFKKSANNQIDPRVILAWEADRYNVEALPDQVRKALANDLIK